MATTKEQFAKAQALIVDKRYDEARLLLETVDHPKAAEWILRIDAITAQEGLWRIDDLEEPEQPKQKVVLAKPKKKRGRGFWIVILAGGCGILVLITVIGQAVGLIDTAEERQATETVVEAQEVAFAQDTATVIALTPATATPTETITPTITPSATITDTPTVTATALPTNTPPPTATATLLPLGTSRTNPHPVNTVGTVQDGRFRINSLRRNMTNAVNQMNMFNEEPGPGQEWIIINASFFCDLDPDKTCNMTLMGFGMDLIGSSGRTYDASLFSVIENSYEGEVFGGGQLTGNLGFIIDQSETGFVLAVNLKRTFFATN